MQRRINQVTLIPYTCENILQAKKKCNKLNIKYRLVDNWLLVDQRNINKL